MDKELEKCEKKVEVARMQAEKIRKMLGDGEGKEAKEAIPESVRKGNEEKLRTYEAEIANLEMLKESFAKLK